jgi:hypothetical protein
MNIDPLIASLHVFPSVLQPLVANLSHEQARWNPPTGAWSVLEIVSHLADEEVEDFRTRVRLTLDDPTQTWPGIDPEGWAVQRRYNEGNLKDVMTRFLRERQKSLRWLDQLEDPNWDLAYAHPKIGPIRAGDVMTSWAAHDLLHLRQITKRRFELIQAAGEPYTTLYAGEWSV